MTTKNTKLLTNAGLLALSLSLAPKTWAVQEAHGGNIVVCTSFPEDGNFRPKEPVVLDYYHASLRTDGIAPELINITGLSEAEVVNTLIERLNKNNPLFAQKTLVALQKIGPVRTWIEADLKHIDDSAEPYKFPDGCHSQTAVAREGTNLLVMYRDPVVLKKVSSAQWGILRMHEAFYLIASENGQKTSANVRNLMRELLMKNTDVNRLNAAIRTIIESDVSRRVPTPTDPERYRCDVPVFSSYCFGDGSNRCYPSIIKGTGPTMEDAWKNATTGLKTKYYFPYSACKRIEATRNEYRFNCVEAATPINSCTIQTNH